MFCCQQRQLVQLSERQEAERLLDGLICWFHVVRACGVAVRHVYHPGQDLFQMALEDNEGYTKVGALRKLHRTGAFFFITLANRVTGEGNLMDPADFINHGFKVSSCYFAHFESYASFSFPSSSTFQTMQLSFSVTIILANYGGGAVYVYKTLCLPNPYQSNST